MSFVRWENDSFSIFVWVDDLLTFLISDVEIDLHQNSNRNLRSIGLGYANSPLYKFGLEKANHVSIPFGPNVNLDDDEPIESSKNKGETYEFHIHM